MVDDVQTFIQDMKLKYNDLRDSAGKVPADASLVEKIQACTAALKQYEEKTIPLKRAIAQNKPKKAKGAKAKAAPNPAPSEPPKADAAS